MNTPASRIRRQLIAFGAAAIVAVSSLPAPAVLAAQAAPPARAGTTTDAPQHPPQDVDPNLPGVQIDIPYFSEPDFLLQAGPQRWAVRNRPAGTVAAGYGHLPDAIHEDLTATARLKPIGGGQPVFVGAIGATRKPLDVAYVAPADLRKSTWMVTRYDDGSVEVEGPVEKGSPSRIVFGLNQDSPTGYVGGTVIGDQGGTAVALVRPNGTIARALVTSGVSFTTIDNLGGSAVAAVSRSVAAFSGSQRSIGRNLRDEAPTVSTLLVVWRSDGQFVPIRIGAGTNGITRLNPMSSVSPVPGVTLGATPAFSPATFDFDWDCVAATVNTANLPIWTGTIASYLGCPTGHDGTPYDTVSLGRISIGAPLKPASGPEVRVITAGDYVGETSLGSTVYLPKGEVRMDSGCAYPGQPTDGSGIVPVGSFDLRMALGVTHLACVEPVAGTVRISEYMQPKNAMAFSLFADPLGRDAEKNQVTRTIQRKTFDHTYEPGDPGSKPDGSVPLQTITYGAISQPTIQVQFPCAHLLARPVRTGLELDDCDQSTPTAGDTQSVAAPPPNWVSYTIAAYATTAVNNVAQNRLIVHTTPASLPLDRTYFDTTTPPAVTTANLSWTVEPSPYLASDLTRLLADPLVDISTFQAYAVPAQNRPRLLLAQVVRPARTTVRIDLGSSGPELKDSPGIPIAVMQAPPLAGGMGQDENFTASFGQSTVSGQESTRSGKTTMGTHVGIEATSTAGGGALGNHMRAGGGASAEFQFTNEVENSVVKAVEMTTGSTYYGTFDDHVIITRGVQEWVWTGKIISDPTGIAYGEPATYREPVQQIVKARTLTTLANEAPGLYGPHGVFGPSLERIVGAVVIGDPSSYRPGADLPQPPSILAANGGPCKGGYVGPNIKTPFTGDLPAVISPENPFYDTVPPTPVGPNIILSDAYSVDIDEGLASESGIVVSSSTTKSLVTALSYDFALTGIFKFEAGVDAGVSANFELTVTAGVDAGWGTGAGVSDTLGESSELVANIAGIPFGGAAYEAWRTANPWVSKEKYDWRMFMCKAQMGPIALGREVWVQGYVTDGYQGVGGIDALADIDLVAPEDASLVRAAATPGPATGMATACTGGPNEFHWDQASGTLRRTSVRFEDTITAAKRSRTVKEWTDPKAFLSTVKRNADDNTPGLVTRPTCAAIDPGAFVDGAFYKATVVTEGFLPDDSVTSNDISVHAEVWPPDQTITAQATVATDGSVKIRIDDPDGVTTLKHHVTIRDPQTQAVVEEGDAGASYQSAPLAPGTYEASVVGFNDHVKPAGGRAETPVAKVQFTYAPNELVPQWSFDCGHNPCTTDDTFQFTDQSTAGTATITKWAWSFGDGTSSTQANPTHRYAAPSPEIGYTVKLKVTDSQGRSATLEQEVMVEESRLPNLTITNVKVNERNAPAKARFTIRLSKASDVPVTVTFKTADGTAVAGKDYAATSGSVTFMPGETVKTVGVKYLQDGKVESTESFKLRLQADAALVNLVDLLGIGKIVDDD